jgi:hypothetical protein
LDLVSWIRFLNLPHFLKATYFPNLTRFLRSIRFLNLAHFLNRKLTHLLNRIWFLTLMLTHFLNRILFLNLTHCLNRISFLKLMLTHFLKRIRFLTLTRFLSRIDFPIPTRFPCERMHQALRCPMQRATPDETPTHSCSGPQMLCYAIQSDLPKHPAFSSSSLSRRGLPVHLVPDL